MRLPRSTKWIVVAIFVVAVAVAVGVAAAAVVRTTIYDTGPEADPTEVRLRMERVRFTPSPDQPTFSSGWHTHPGPVIFQVHSGQMKITQGLPGGPCKSEKLGPGETAIEPPETPIIAEAKKETVWTVSLIVPASKPLAGPATDPCP